MIQYAAASRFITTVPGIPGRPVKPGDDDLWWGDDGLWVRPRADYPLT
jgi:hypothetical protein